MNENIYSFYVEIQLLIKLAPRVGMLFGNRKISKDKKQS